jgi:hypothetical protein
MRNSLTPACAVFLAIPEDGGDMYLRNVWISPNYMTLQHKDRILRNNAFAAAHNE